MRPERGISKKGVEGGTRRSGRGVERRAKGGKFKLALQYSFAVTLVGVRFNRDGSDPMTKSDQHRRRFFSKTRDNNTPETGFAVADQVGFSTKHEKSLPSEGKD